MNIKWEAEKYVSKFDFVPQYGKDIINLIDCPKGSKVLDLGCGNGTLTRQLADQGFQVMGLDASAELINLAKEHYPDILFKEGDATDFTLEEKVDVVFSNAVFHWIDQEKHPLLLQQIGNALNQGGELVCEFGGQGNNAKIHQALSRAFAQRHLTYRMPFYFPSIGEYAPLLEQKGLQVRFVTLFDRFTELKGKNGLHDWICMFLKTSFRGLEQELVEEIV